jgi:hypothetical protein
MQPTMTIADWLRRAADAWSEADATQDQEARRAKILVAEGCERLAKHAAFLAEGDAYPPVGWFSDLKRFVERICLPFGLRFQRLRTAKVPLKPRLPESPVRGLVALLATPFLLLAALGLVLCAIAAHKRRAETARRRSRWWVAADIAAAVLGVGALDLLVNAF